MSHRLLLSLFSIVFASLLAVAPAMAELKKLNAHPSRTELAATCEKAGGSYADVPADKEMGSAANYHCTTKCKGGSCMVMCTDSGCVGSTPSNLTGPQTLLSILQNGDLVYRQLEPVSTGSLGGGGDSGSGALDSSSADGGGGGGDGGCEFTIC